MKIKTDLLLHASACFVLTVVVSALLWFLKASIVVGALVAIAVGIAKEVRDIFKSDGFNLNDLWADLIVALSAAVCLCLIKYPLW